MISLSMFSSPNSFSITAIFRPCGSLSTRRRSVDLPAPRKPVSTVAGMRFPISSAQQHDSVTTEQCAALAGADSVDVRFAGGWRGVGAGEGDVLVVTIDLLRAA